MRKILLSLTALAGAAFATASQAGATPARFTAPVLSAPAYVQTVREDEDWRAREWRRHEEWERHRREEERRRWHEWHRG